MASATFTLRAVDQTRAAFASVQNSLQRLENQTKGIAKITKLAFGGEAVLGTLNLMKQRLDKVIESGDQMGFDDEQIGTALRFEDAINGILKTLTAIPLAVAKLGFEIGNAFSPLTDEQLKKRIEELRAERFAKEIRASGEALKKLREEFDLIGLSEGKRADLAVERAKAMQAEAEAMRGRDPVGAARKEEEAQRLINDAKQTTVGLNRELRQAQDELNKSLIDAQSVGLSRPEIIDGLRKRYFQLTEQITKLNVQMSAFAFVGRPIGETQDELIAKTKELTAVSAQLNKLLEEQSKIATEAGQITAGAFENAILSGEKLRDTLQALAQDLLRLLFRQQITEPLAKGIGSFFKTLPFFANGGPITGNQPAIVGERGPELFVPSTSGRIISNSAMRSGGGAPAMGGVTVNYNIAAGVTRGELVPILEAERKRLKAEIPDMVRRGGAYRAAFA